MSSDDDYMSAAFLDESVAPPSSLLPASKRRKLKANDHSVVKSKRQTLMEGLSTEISSDNVGFKMLSKMGFKKGNSLGLSGGITEPIPIVLKSDKSGLGQSKEELRMTRPINDKSNLAVVETDPDEFRNKIANRYEIKQIKDDVKKARNIIEQMDMTNEKPANELWPTRKNLVEDGDATEFDLLAPEMQLKQTMLYLRSVYRYCIYCGCSFDSEKEMDRECPGETRGDHE